MTTYANGTPAPVEAYAVVERVTKHELMALKDTPFHVEEYAEQHTNRPFTLVYAPDGKGPPKILPHLF